MHKVKTVADTPGHVAEVWELDTPCVHNDHSFTHVLVSAVDNPVLDVYETYVFACSSDGEVSCWDELPGSVKGVFDIDVALSGFLAWLDEQAG